MNAPFNHARAANREPFAAYVCDDTTAETLRPLATEFGWSADKVFRGGLRNAVQQLSVSASPMVLFVDLSESGDPLHDINALAEVCEPGTIVLATGQVNDVRLFRELVASGIQDYLLKPLSPDMMREAFAGAQHALNAPKPVDAVADRPHCSTAVIGARGGVGATTLATSLAWLLAEKQGHPVGLLDLDVHFGTGALALDIEPGRGLTDAIENPGRIDGLFIERAMVKATEKLAVLSAEAPINSPIMTDGTAFFQLQEEIRAAFEHTIIDLPRSMLVQYPHLITDVQVAIVATELTLAAARDTIRLLSWLKSNAPQTRVIVVANKVHPGAALEISRKDFESTIERAIDVQVSFDQKLAAQAAKLGKTFVDAGKGSKTIVPITDLAVTLAAAATAEEAAAKAKPQSLLERLGIGAKKPGGAKPAKKLLGKKPAKTA